MATGTLSPQVQVIAEHLQETAMAMGHSEIHGHLSKALGSDAFVHDVNGDDKSGDVVYSKSGGKIKKASYRIRAGEDGKAAAKIDEENAVKVTPRTVFEAVTLRGESARSTWKPEGVLLVESSANFCEEPRLSEAASAHYPIKLMSPGRGSSGYYPPETLKKAAQDNVFKAGTQMFWNHDTDAEEAARPEGDLTRLAAVTTSDAKYVENGYDGSGLYAQAKVFADYADKVKEMGPHIGLSIRAGGDRNESAIAPDGKPRVITALKNAASVDFVTKAGRDGKIFTESATREGEQDVDEAQVLKLIERANAPIIAENKALKEMLAATRAPAIIGKHLDGIRLPDPVKAKIAEALAYSIPTDEAGKVDDVKLKALVEAKAKEWADLLPSLGVNINPASLGTRMTEAEVKDDIKVFEADSVAVGEALADLFVGPKLIKGSASEEAREARKVARKTMMTGRAA
jgi:hypothetical protein